MSLCLTLTLNLGAVLISAGFQVSEHSARATGRAASAVATADDPSAVFYNAAGLTQVEGLQAEVGVTFIRPSAEFRGLSLDGTTRVRESNRGEFIPVPNLYLTRQLGEQAFLGFGVDLAYGLAIKYPDAFVGRTTVKEIDLRTYHLTAAFAWKFSEGLSVSAGATLIPSTLYLARTLGAVDNRQILFPAATPANEGQLELSGRALGASANLGVQARFTRELRVGAQYRSTASLDYRGQAHFRLPAGTPDTLRRLFPDQTVRAHLDLPHSAALGVGWQSEHLTLELSGHYTAWQSFDEVRIDFDQERPSRSVSTSYRWKGAPAIRAGGELRVGDSAFRAGAAYDLSPVPDATIDPLLPDNNRYVFSAGVGHELGAFRLDLAYMGVWITERVVNNSVNFSPGTWSGGLTHLLGLTLGARI